MSFILSNFTTILLFVAFFITGSLYIKKRHINYVLVLLSISTLLAINFLPELSKIMHIFLMIIVVYSFIRTRQRWWIPIVVVQSFAFIYQVFPNLMLVQFISNKNNVYVVLGAIYAATLVYSLNTIIFNTINGKTHQQDAFMVKKYFQKAKEHMDHQNYGKALELFNKAIDIDQQNSELYLQRGNAYKRLGDLGQAIKDYERAKELSPKDALIYYCLANAYRELELYKKGLEYSHQAIRLEPRDSDFLYERGRNFEFLGRIEKAIEDYTKAIKYDDQCLLAYERRGNIYYKQKQFDKALEDYNNAIRIDSEDDTNYHERATIYQAMGDYSNALEDFDQAIKLDTNEYMYFYNRALAYMHVNEYDKAFADLNQALQMEKDDASLYNTRGCLYLHKQELERASDDINQAIRVDKERTQELEGYDDTDVRESDLQTKEGNKKLIYKNLKIAIELEYPVDSFLQFPIFEPYLNESPFQQLVQEYREKQDN